MRRRSWSPILSILPSSATAFLTCHATRRSSITNIKGLCQTISPQSCQVCSDCGQRVPSAPPPCLLVAAPPPSSLASVVHSGRSAFHASSGRGDSSNRIPAQLAMLPHSLRSTARSSQSAARGQDGGYFRKKKHSLKIQVQNLDLENVTSSAGTPLCPYGIAYRSAYGPLCTCNSPSQSSANRKRSKTMKGVRASGRASPLHRRVQETRHAASRCLPNPFPQNKQCIACGATKFHTHVIHHHL